MEGKAILCSHPEILISQGDPFFPMTEQFCLKNETALRFYVHKTNELIPKGRWVNNLNFFHKLIFQYYFIFDEEIKKSIIIKLMEKKAEEEETLNSVFKQMISLLNPEDITSVTVSTDPLFIALQLIGKKNQMHIPPSSRASNP